MRGCRDVSLGGIDLCLFKGQWSQNIIDFDSKQILKKKICLHLVKVNVWCQNIIDFDSKQMSISFFFTFVVWTALDFPSIAFKNDL